MKVLSTEQQADLQALIQSLVDEAVTDVETNSLLAYWAIELKPKRIRKKKEENTETVVDNTQLP